MGILTPVDASSTKKIEHENGEDYILVRDNLSKRELNAIIRGLPRGTMVEDGDAIEIAIQTPEVLFGVLVKGWSVALEPTVESYLTLPPEATNWIDTVLLEHFNQLSLSKEEQGKPSTSPRGTQKGTRAA